MLAVVVVATQIQIVNLLVSPPHPSLRIHYLPSRDEKAEQCTEAEQATLRHFTSLQGTSPSAANGLVRWTVISTTPGNPPDSTPNRSLSLRACAIQAPTCTPRLQREYPPPFLRSLPFPPPPFLLPPSYPPPPHTHTLEVGWLVEQGRGGWRISVGSDRLRGVC